MISKKKFSWLALFLALFFTEKGICQHYNAGVFGGTTYYLGELNPEKQFVNQVNPFLGVFVRKNINKRYSLRTGLNFGRLSATDRLNANALPAVRQLAFSGTILEAFGQIELNFLPYQIHNPTTSNFSPFLFVGIAGFWTNTKLETISNDVFLASTSLIAPSIPFGMGIKFDFIQNLGLSVEWSMKKTFTDRIDGLGNLDANGYQISNTNNKDWYSFAGITLNYKFLTKYDKCPVVSSPY